MNSGFDCSAVGGSFSSHTTGTTRVCISDSDPSVWKCPENFVRLAAAPFCKAKPRGGKTCKVPRMEQPLHVFLNHCSEGQVLADGEACDLSCLKTWRSVRRAHACVVLIFQKPALLGQRFAVLLTLVCLHDGPTQDDWSATVLPRRRVQTWHHPMQIYGKCAQTNGCARVEGEGSVLLRCVETAMPLHRAPRTGKEGRGAHAHSRRKDLSQFGRE